MSSAAVAVQAPFDLDVVDLHRYPLFEPSSARYREVVGQIQRELREDGCSVVRGFFRAGALAALRSEAEALAPRAYRHDIRTNAYSTIDDPGLPPDHPVRLFMDRSNAFVAKDRIPVHAWISRVYHDRDFQRFVADCLEERQIFEYADPFAGLVLNCLAPGCQHPWHYDTNEFIVSSLLAPTEAGGVFEYCPGIRRPGEERYDQVSRVIRGLDRAPVKTLRLAPGDLQLFRGRFSLHRVTRVEGARERLTAIFAYAARPGVIGKVERTRQLFGRVAPEHLAAAAAARDDGLVD